MRTIIIVSTLLLGLGLAPATTHAAPASAPDKGSAKTRILGAIDLPLKAQALRKAGADEKDVKAGLAAIKDKKLPAGEAAEVLDAVAESTREHGPVDNFGAFVKGQLEAGLRGKDLAAAIRSEHASRGKNKKAGPPADTAGGPPADTAGGPPADTAGGPPADKGPGEHGKPDDKGPGEHGKPDDKAGAPTDPGKPADAGKPDDKGKPADAGKPDDKGKPDDAKQGPPADKAKGG